MECREIEDVSVVFVLLLSLTVTRTAEDFEDGGGDSCDELDFPVIRSLLKASTFICSGPADAVSGTLDLESRSLAGSPA